MTASAAHPSEGGTPVPDLESANYTLVVLTIVGILVGWARGWWESPKRRTEREQNREIHEAILGEPERRDRSNQITHEARPGLVALQRGDSERLSKVEEAVVELTHVTMLNAKHQRQLDSHEARITTHDHAIAALIAGSAERAATAMASAEMLRLVNERDTTDGHVEEEGP